MHKGYAFVQFTNPFDARSACLGEDGRTVLSQVLGKMTNFFPHSLSRNPHFYKNLCQSVRELGDSLRPK